MTTPNSLRPSMWQRSTTRRFLKWLFSWRSIRWAVKAVAVLLIVFAVVYLVCLYVANRWLQQAYAALEKDGRPMKAADIIPPEIPDSENGAVLIQAAVEQLEAKKEGDESLFSRLGYFASFMRRDTPEGVTNEQEFKKLLAQDIVAKALRQVEEGAGKPKCLFPLDFCKYLNKPREAMKWQLGNFRYLMRILSARVRIQAQEGNAHAAWRGVISCLKMANGLVSDPLPLCNLLRIVGLGMAGADIHEICEKGPPDEEEFDIFDRLLSEFEDTRPWVGAFDGERLLEGEWLFPRARIFQIHPNGGIWADPHTQGEDERELWGQMPLQLGAWLLFKPLRVADHAAYLRIMLLNAREAAHPFALYNDEADNTYGREPTWHLLTHALACHFEVKRRECNSIAYARVTRAGLALLRYKKAHGAFPESLDRIEPGMRIDPFTGQPLHYRREGAGFLIYSVGPNRKDDGGLGIYDRPRTCHEDQDDIAWKFPHGEGER